MSCSSRHRLTITTLNLSNQRLTAIPDSIFSLEQLTCLELGNRFTLYPPLSALGQEYGSGDSMNTITTIPKDIEQLQNLRVLGFCFNDLKSLPTELSSLKQLDTLDISFNKSLNISAEIETLKKLQGLKYLNVIATNADEITIDKLRKALPKTTIYTRPEDRPTETVE